MSSPVRKLVRLQRLSFYHAFTLLLHSFCRLLNSDWSIQISVAQVVCKAVPGPIVVRFSFESQWWSLWEFKIWFKRLNRPLIFSLHWCSRRISGWEKARSESSASQRLCLMILWKLTSAQERYAYKNRCYNKFDKLSCAGLGSVHEYASVFLFLNRHSHCVLYF